MTVVVKINVEVWGRRGCIVVALAHSCRRILDRELDASLGRLGSWMIIPCSAEMNIFRTSAKGQG